MTAVLRVRVVPRARRNALVLDASGALKVWVTAPPVEGAANRAVVDLLASRLGFKRNDLEVVRGSHGRDKQVRVNGCSAAELAARLSAATGSDVDKTGRGG